MGSHASEQLRELALRPYVAVLRSGSWRVGVSENCSLWYSSHLLPLCPMSPTAQPDVRPSSAPARPHGTSATNNNSSSGGIATITNPNPGSASETRGKEQRKTIVIISISYFEWLDKQGKNPMKLMSVRNDLDLQLIRHNYLHQGTETDFLIYTDYEHEYTDSTGTRAPVSHGEATRLEILGGLAKAVGHGGNVVIYYSGHCARRGAGNSTLTLKDGYWRYEEDGVPQAGPPYLISGDCHRIYGKDVYDAMKKGMGAEPNMTITLIFDTCHAATFFDTVITFPCVYRARAIGGSTVRPRKAQGSQTQIIFLTATQFHQKAGTFTDAILRRENGAVTKVITQFFNEAIADPEAPRSVEALVEKLYDRCRERQTPEIKALFPILGEFINIETT